MTQYFWFKNTERCCNLKKPKTFLNKGTKHKKNLYGSLNSKKEIGILKVVDPLNANKSIPLD